MLFLEPTVKGVNFSDFFKYEYALSHDHINSVINPTHVMNFSMIIHPYSHQGSQGVSQNLKFGIRFFLINNSFTDWLYDSKEALYADFDRLKQNLCH